MPGLDSKTPMFPPRYFVGWIILQHRDGSVRRVEFENALLIPITPCRAYIFAGSWTTAFYGPPVAQSKLKGWVREIQYAISALNSKTLRPEIEKFKHPFTVMPFFSRDTDHFVISVRPEYRTHLFLTQPLKNVLDHAQGSRIPVIQFSA